MFCILSLSGLDLGLGWDKDKICMALIHAFKFLKLFLLLNILFYLVSQSFITKK